MRPTTHRTDPQRGKLSLAIIGCGAVAQERYIPASHLISNTVDITYVVDINVKRAEEVAQRFQIPNYVDDYHRIIDKVDAVVVATPPKSHASIAIHCLTHGTHVLCEKPMALSVEEAEKMVKVSRDSQTHLAIGMNRRLCLSSRIANFLLNNRFLGKIDRFEIEEGHKFNWPLRSFHIFTGNEGILLDTGPHLLDLLFWLLGNDVEISKYRDDSFGGVEANAQIELKIIHNSDEISGTVELSFTRHLRNTIRIFGERGYIDVPVLGGKSVIFHELSNPDRELEIQFNNISAKNRIEQFAEQLARFASSISDNEVRYVPGTEGIPVIKAIRECYNIRETMMHSWEMKHISLRLKNGN